MQEVDLTILRSCSDHLSMLMHMR